MKIKVILSIVALSFIFLSCGVNTKQVRRMQQLETGVVNPTTISELEHAIKTYQNRIEDVLNSDIRIGLWYKILATRYLDNGMYAKALENFRTAIEFFPQNQNLYYYVGLCAGFMSKAALEYDFPNTLSQKAHYLNLAESAYLRAIELEPRYERALYGLSILYVFELDQPEKAIKYLETILDIEKRNFDAMMVLARAYYVTGNGEKSIDLYDRVASETKSEERKNEALENKKFVINQIYE